MKEIKVLKRKTWDKMVIANSFTSQGLLCITGAVTVMEEIEEFQVKDEESMSKIVSAGVITQLGLYGDQVNMVAKLVAHYSPQGKMFKKCWNEKYGKDVSTNE